MGPHTIWYKQDPVKRAEGSERYGFYVVRKMKELFHGLHPRTKHKVLIPHGPTDLRTIENVVSLFVLPLIVFRLVSMYVVISFARFLSH